MKKQIEITVVNELLRELGYNNIKIVNTPYFHWNGESITDDETTSSKRVGSYHLKNGFKNFIDKNKNNKIIIAPTPDGKLIDHQYNTVRAYIDDSENQKEDTLKRIEKDLESY